MVRFKEHSFVVSSEIAGKTVVAEGVLHVETTSVEERRHLAEDAGKSAAEVAAITTPKLEVSLEATGLMLVGSGE